MTGSEHNCQTCLTITCEFNPANPEAYFIDPENEEPEIYPGIECIYEFTAMKGCAVHSAFIAPLDVLEEEIREGQGKYQEKIDEGVDGNAYTLAWKALNVCLQRIERLRGQRR